MSCAGSAEGADDFVACSHSSCAAKYCCSSACLPESFDTRWSACGKCIVSGAIVSKGGKQVGVIKGDAIDEVVLMYAKGLARSLQFIAMLGALTVLEPAGKTELDKDTIDAIQRVLPVGGLFHKSQTMLLERTLDLVDRYADEDRAMQEREIVQGRKDLHSHTMDGLLCDIAAMLHSFVYMKSLLSCKESSCRLELYHLDTMQTLYQRKLCGYCFCQVSRNDVLRRCGDCKAIYYCDKRCQALGWPTHSQHCACMKDARKEYNKKILVKNTSKALPRPAPQAVNFISKTD